MPHCDPAKPHCAQQTERIPRGRPLARQVHRRDTGFLKAQLGPCAWELSPCARPTPCPHFSSHPQEACSLIPRLGVAHCHILVPVPLHVICRQGCSLPGTGGGGRQQVCSRWLSQYRE